ncbi:MAG: hypothetical protein Q9174_003662 [Haloplaca sp. 1 TL-2023]
MGTLPPSLVHPSNRIAAPAKTAKLNVQHVVLGDLLFKTWYPSYYPEDVVGREVDRLHVCQWCFKYSRELVPFLAHRKLCTARDQTLPGQAIYSKDGYSVYQVDGEENQNLSLFAKLFLDNKSIFFDVASFDYFLLVQQAPNSSLPSLPSQIVGFFSKEKMSWDNNNLACILVFPPWQRKGLGKILMGVSYELSRLEARVGGPEKPLSELGRIGYLKFWEARVANAVLGMKKKSRSSVQEIADACWMLPEDVMATLKEMDILETKKRKDGSVVINKTRKAKGQGDDEMGDASEEALILEAQKAFLQQLVLAKQSEDYHDLIISCEGRQWKVHRVVEGETQSIDLKEEDPDLIEALVDYLYSFDYEDRRQAQPSLQSSASKTLSINANMYIVGDRYNLRELKDLARQKFQTALSKSWDKENLPDVIRTIYDNTLSSDRGLRDCLIPILQSQKTVLRAREAFMQLVSCHGEFAIDLIDAWAGLTPPNPRGVSERDWWCENCQSSGHSDDFRCPGCNEELQGFS